MLSSQAFVQTLQGFSAQTLLPLSVKQCQDFYAYHQLLLHYNKVMDLTSIVDEQEIMLRHYLDSLSILTFSEAFSHNPSIIDVGSGAGFPGLPMAIVLKNSPILLLDAQKKRVDFLQEVVNTLSLKNVTVLHGRAEDLARQANFREHFDIATARAVAPLPILLEYLLPFVKIGGYALCLKGPKGEEELITSTSAAQILKGELRPPLPLSLPIKDYAPILAICQKTGTTPAKYPRKAGIPAKRPL